MFAASLRQRNRKHTCYPLDAWQLSYGRAVDEAADALLADSGESSEDVEVEQSLPRRRAPVASSRYTIDVASCSRSSSGLSSPRHDHDKPPRSNPSLGPSSRVASRKLIRLCALLAAGAVLGSIPLGLGTGRAA